MRGVGVADPGKLPAGRTGREVITARGRTIQEASEAKDLRPGNWRLPFIASR